MEVVDASGVELGLDELEYGEGELEVVTGVLVLPTEE